MKGAIVENERAIRWLLSSSDPSVRYFTHTDLLETPAESEAVQASKRQIPNSERVQILLTGQHPDGGFGVHPYHKWTGAHWRLVSLVELGVPPGFAPALRAVEQELAWLTGDQHRLHAIQLIEGRTRRCASQEGNALAVCCRLGMADDPRVRLLAHSLLDWQWPDGGWNCDKAPAAHHSSFHESLTPLWGLTEYHRATGERAVLTAARRTAEFILRHRLFRSETTGEIIHPSWTKLHYPPYWHYDVLAGLLVLSRLMPSADPGMAEALDLVEGKRRADGLWHPAGYYWNPPGSARSVEVLDWGRGGPSEMLTLNALRVLKAAGRLTADS
jgi:hypothetical protein